MNTLFMKRTAGIFQVINLCRAAVTPLSLLKGLAAPSTTRLYHLHLWWI